MLEMFSKESQWLSDKEYGFLLRFWDLSPDDDREQNFAKIIEKSKNLYKLRHALEGLSKIELKILLYVVKFPDGCTLGEVSKTLFIPPQTLEAELHSLRQYGFLYLRRNRERLTNTRDKYYLFNHLVDRINIPIREHRENFLFQNARELFGKKVNQNQFSPDNLKTILEESSEQIREILDRAFTNGGAIKISDVIAVAGDAIEETLQYLEENYLGKEIAFYDDNYFRFLVIPQEVISNYGRLRYVKQCKEGAAAEYLGFDFILNLKKTLFHIQSKGMILTQALRLKMADSRKLLQTLIPCKLDPISPIKLIDQLEFILPILRLLDLLEIKDSKLALTPNFQEFLDRSPILILSDILAVIFEKGDKVVYYEEIFNPSDMPFFSEEDFKLVIGFMDRDHAHGLNWLLTQFLQERVYRNAHFSTSDLNRQIQKMKRNFVQSIFYMFLFGLITYDTRDEDIFIAISNIGKHCLDNNLDTMEKNFYTACLFFNPDLTIIIDKNIASELVLYIMKAFTKIEDENQVITLSLNRDTFQQGVMIGFKPSVFTETILNCFKTPLPQNVEYFLQEWSRNIQIATISQMTVIMVEEKEVLDNLIQQPKLKGIFTERLGEKAAAVESSQVQNLILAAERLNIIIKLFS